MLSRSDARSHAPAGRRRTVALLLALLSALVLLYIARAPILTAFANAWIVDQPLHKADAIVILGGNLTSRPTAAAELHRQGLAPILIHFDVLWEPGPLIGWDNSERELTRQILHASGIPPDAIVTVGSQVSSSYEEAMAIRDWAATNQIHSLIIVTDMFHTRRVRWLYRKQLQDLMITPQMAPVPHRHYAADNWWTTEHGLIDFWQEWVKLPLYWVKY